MGLMRRRFLGPALLFPTTLFLPACFTLEHTVGRGPQTIGPQQVQETRWFALYGLWPLNEVDSQRLAGEGTRDYRVVTKFTYVDVVISAITSFASIYCQTVIVEK